GPRHGTSGLVLLLCGAQYIQISLVPLFSQKKAALCRSSRCTGGPISNNGLSFPRTSDLHLVSIFRNGTAREFHTFLAQYLRALLVGQRFLRVLILDHLLDLQFEDTRRDLFAFLIHHSFAEEAAKLDDALRGMSIFTIYNTRDRR